MFLPGSITVEVVNECGTKRMVTRQAVAVALPRVQLLLGRLRLDIVGVDIDCPPRWCIRNRARRRCGRPSRKSPRSRHPGRDSSQGSWQDPSGRWIRPKPRATGANAPRIRRPARVRPAVGIWCSALSSSVSSLKDGGALRRHPTGDRRARKASSLRHKEKGAGPESRALLKFVASLNRLVRRERL